MERIAEALCAAVVVTVVLGAVAANADSPGKYPDYDIGREAFYQGDCPTAVEHLTAFIERYPEFREQQPEFYVKVKLAIKKCAGKVSIRGIGEDSDGIAPLPDHPPTTQ